MTTGEGELARTGTEAEAEDVPAGDAELGGLVVAAGVGAGDDVARAVGLGAVADGDGVGAGEAEDGVAAGDAVGAGVTLTVAAGGGRTSR